MMIDLANYDTIIFDFGGVIFDINPQLSIDAFNKFGGNNGMEKVAASDILWQFERGEISVETLHYGVCKHLNAEISIPDFIKAWNALLLEFKLPRIEKIKGLAKTHRLFMLSNTNEIHYAHFSKKLADGFGLTFHDLFQEVYLSYKMGYVKPDLEIYKQVLLKEGLNASKTLFIEDSKENAAAANKLGIQTLVIPRNGSFYDYFI